MTHIEFQTFCISLFFLGLLVSPYHLAVAWSNRLEDYLVSSRNILLFPSWLVVILFGK
ncbi:MAG: hypothetical protein UZ14_CFX002001166 [Chloroflexi bacterium OLB14]|nr:MAG: hypothetical protein UZ14_CFX002001166 [Chloroflexi bacterium OLB14]